MKKGSMKEAKKLFYAILNGKLSKREGLEHIYRIANKKKILKGYYFGVKGIILKQNDNPYSLKVESLKRNEIKYLIKKMEYYLSSRFTNEFDRGYMYAWIDYLRYHIGETE